MHRSEFEDAYDDDLPEESLLDLPISKLELRPAVLVDCAATVADAVEAMNVNHTGCVLVQRNGRLAGIFTERDVITRVFGLEDCHSVRVESVMTPDPESLETKDNLAFALNHMSVGGFRHIPIIERGQPVGVLSVRDIVDFLSETYADSIVNLPPSPDSAVYRTVDGG